MNSEDQLSGNEDQAASAAQNNQSARAAFDHALAALRETFSSAEKEAERTLSEAVTDTSARRVELDELESKLAKTAKNLEGRFAEANKLLESADHRHRLADDRMRDADAASERASSTLSTAIQRAEILFEQAEAKAEEFEKEMLAKSEERIAAAWDAASEAENDSGAIVAQAQQRADKLVADAEEKATKTIEGARAFKKLQLTELESREGAARERLRAMLNTIESSLTSDSPDTIDLREELDESFGSDDIEAEAEAEAVELEPVAVGNSESTAGVDEVQNDEPTPDPSRAVINDAVRKAFDRWSADDKTSS